MKSLALHRAKNIPGWMSDVELSILAELAQESKVIFEIGSYQGRSTRALGDNTKGVVYAIDPWGIQNFSPDIKPLFETDETIFNLFYCYNHDLIDSKKIIPVRSTWQDYKPAVLSDFIFIDGNHLYEEVKKDIIKAKVYLEYGGIIAGHDYSRGWPGVVQAVNEIFEGQRVNLHDSVWWTRL